MAREIKQDFDILVWYRYVVNGEQEKEFDCHNIPAQNIQEAINKASDLYKSHSRIPFAYYHKGEKYAPNNFDKLTLFKN